MKKQKEGREEEKQLEEKEEEEVVVEEVVEEVVVVEVEWWKRVRCELPTFVLVESSLDERHGSGSISSTAARG